MILDRRFSMARFRWLWPLWVKREGGAAQTAGSEPDRAPPLTGLDKVWGQGELMASFGSDGAYRPPVKFPWQLLRFDQPVRLAGG
jgi:hypothetical protein